MSLLDRYVARIVAGAFAAALTFFLLLSILIDLLNNLSRYLDRAESRGVTGFDLATNLAVYYAKMVPGLFTTVTPFATVIACMFAVARLRNANELVPMLFVGRSMHRILRPMLLCGLLAGLAMAACWQWVVPVFGASLAADATFLKEDSTTQKNLVHESHEATSQRLYVREYDPSTTTMLGVAMLVEGDLVADTTLTEAASAVWDPAQKDWRLTKGLRKRRHDNGAASMPFIEGRPQVWLERPDLTPNIVLQQGRDTVDPDSVSYTELQDLIVARPNRAVVRMTLHRHITYPLANLLLLLLALPMAVYFERGSRIERVLLAIALCGGYLLFDLTCQSLGQRGVGLHPIVAAWSPTILFGALGLVLFGSIKT